MKRRMQPRGKSKRQFRATAGRVRKENYLPPVMRGGTRL